MITANLDEPLVFTSPANGVFLFQNVPGALCTTTKKFVKSAKFRAASTRTDYYR